MTINDLKEVYAGPVVVTVVGYFKSGEYYSSYTYTVEDEYKIFIGDVDEYTANLEIKNLWCCIGIVGTLMIDVVSIIDEPDEDES